MNINTENCYLDARILDAFMWGNADEIKNLINEGVSCLANNPMISGMDKNGNPVDNYFSYTKHETLLHKIAGIFAIEGLNDGQKEDFFEVAQLVLGKGENVNTKDESGCTSLHRAVLSGDIEFATFLRQHGALTSIENNFKETPITLADRLGYRELSDSLKKPVKIISASEIGKVKKSAHTKIKD